MMLHKREHDGTIGSMTTPTDAIREALRNHPAPTMLARRLGVPPSVVARFIHGETSMTLRNVDRLWPELGLEIRPTRAELASKRTRKGGK